MTRVGALDRHVEVKGSRTAGDEVELTANELDKARQHPAQAVLAIVTGIELDGDAAAGGSVALLDPWHPDDAHPTPTRFHHRAPRGGDG